VSPDFQPSSRSVTSGRPGSTGFRFERVVLGRDINTSCAAAKGAAVTTT
jgi:hypothetical protein